MKMPRVLPSKPLLARLMLVLLLLAAPAFSWMQAASLISWSPGRAAEESTESAVEEIGTDLDDVRYTVRACRPRTRGGSSKRLTDEYSSKSAFPAIALVAELRPTKPPQRHHPIVRPRVFRLLN